ncbi:hypothetical protein H920_09496 [Fukomys damarensis]|uniref:Uncharacterized protein n=1 Tax=Fukomys damarensis TaxID=885580 RepID=A0A091E235_FUKDA|nr:hypothetical protein H920_09496 [Fukomys damarensis]
MSLFITAVVQKAGSHSPLQASIQKSDLETPDFKEDPNATLTAQSAFASPRGKEAESPGLTLISALTPGHADA